MRILFYLSGFAVPALLAFSGLPEGFDRFDGEAIAANPATADLITQAPDSNRDSAVEASLRAYLTESQDYASQGLYEEAIAAQNKAKDVVQQYVDDVEQSEGAQSTALAIAQAVIPIYEESIHSLLTHSRKLRDEEKYELDYKQLDLVDRLAQQSVELAERSADLVPSIQDENVRKEIHQSVSRLYEIVGFATITRTFTYSAEEKFEEVAKTLQQALEPYKTGLSYAVKSGDPSLIIAMQSNVAYAQTNLAITFHTLQQHEKTIAAALSGLEIAEEISAREIVLSLLDSLRISYSGLSDTSRISGDYEQATDFAKTALQYAERMLSLAEREIQIAGEDFPEDASLSVFVDSEEKRQEVDTRSFKV